MLSDPFFLNCLSNTLIYSYGAIRLRILDGTTFDNIWLLDKINEFDEQSGGDDSLNDYGLVLYLRNFNGVLIISGNAANPVKFINMVGYINDHTVSIFDKWHPQLLVPGAQTNTNRQFQQRFLNQGVSSVFFNVQNNKNMIIQLSLEYIKFNFIYAKMRLYKDKVLPLILKTELNSQSFYSIVNVTLSDIDLSDATFENSAGFFQILAQNTVIKNLKVTNVGHRFSYLKTFNVTQGLLFQNFEEQTKSLFIVPFVQELVPIGVGVYLDFANNFSLSNSTFEKLTGLNAPVLNFMLLKNRTLEKLTRQITIKNCYFKSISANGQAQSAIIYDSSDFESNIDAIISNSRFIDNYGYNGLVRYSKALSGRVTFIDCEFSGNQGIEARVFYLQNDLVNEFRVINSVFTNREIYGDSFILKQMARADAQINVFIKPSLITVNNFLKSIVIMNCTGQNSHFSEAGGFARLVTKSSIIIRNSKFSGLSAGFGGVISATQGSNVFLDNCEFFNNKALTGGVMIFSDLSNLSGRFLTIKQNLAFSAGVLRLSGASFVTFLNDSLIQQNQAIYSETIGQLNEITLAIFNRVKFLKNSILDIAYEIPDLVINQDRSQGMNGISIQNTAYWVNFTDCEFTDNQASKINGYLYINTAQRVFFKRSIFRNYLNRYTNEEAVSFLRGGFLHVVADSKVFIEDSSFSQGFALEGGAIFTLGSTSIYIKNSSFSQNFAIQNGGAFSAISFRDFILTNCVLIDNQSQDKESDIFYALNGDNKLSFISSQLLGKRSGTILQLREIRSIELRNTSVKVSKMTSESSLYNSALIIYNAKQLRIVDCEFNQLISTAQITPGGAITLSESFKNKDSRNSLIIENSKFIGCSGIYGGALSIQDVANVVIRGDKTLFQNNYASVGGAIAFVCQDYKMEKTFCSLTIEDGTFQNNNAQIQGGAISWNFYEPTMKEGIIFLNNSAGIYGNNIAGVAQKLKKTDGIYNKRFLQTVPNKVSNVQSGGKINMYFVLQDKYGQIITTDNQSKLFISSVNEKTDASVMFTSSIESQTQINCVNGTFSIEDFIFVGQPNSTRKIKISTDAINYDIPSNQEYLQNQSIAGNQTKSALVLMSSELNIEASESVEVAFDLRSCEPGEELLSSGKCRKCDSGQYLLVAPLDNKPQMCKECPPKEKAVCDGGASIYPQPGYWRSSNISDNFMECRNGDACLGRNGEENNTLGACAKGYEGILCADCAIGFSRTGSSYKCSKCPEEADNAVKITFMFIIVIAGVVFLVRSTLQGAMQKKDFLSVFVRILMNHFQLLTLTASFDLDWPSQLKQFFAQTKPVSEATTQFLSLDCFIDARKNSMGTAVVRIFYAKLIMLAIIPFVVMGVSYIVWNAIFRIEKCKKNRQKKYIEESRNNISQNEAADVSSASILQPPQQRDPPSQQDTSSLFVGRVLSTIIVVLFLVHPTITTIMFNAFNCQNIDGTERLYEDLEIICYKGHHSMFALGVALPALIIWSLGIPSVALFLIFKRRKELNLIDVKAKYGFLYNGYRNPQAYYWEIVIMYRKIAIIFIQVFLSQVGKIVQALTMLLFLIMFMTVTAMKQPYANHALNSLEALSLLSSGITVYCGIFYIANSSFKEDKNFSMSPEAQLFMFSVIVIAHVFFFFYWVFHFLQEFRATFRTRFPKLYISLFLCCRDQSLQTELQIERYREKMRPFLQSIDDLLDYLNERKQMYANAQVPREDEAFKRLLVQNVQYLRRLEQLSAYKEGEKVLSIDRLVKERRVQEGGHSMRQRKGKQKMQMIKAAEMMQGNVRLSDYSFKAQDDKPQRKKKQIVEDILDMEENKFSEPLQEEVKQYSDKTPEITDLEEEIARGVIVTTNNAMMGGQMPQSNDNATERISEDLVQQTWREKKYEEMIQRKPKQAQQQLRKELQRRHLMDTMVKGSIKRSRIAAKNPFEGVSEVVVQSMGNSKESIEEEDKMSIRDVSPNIDNLQYDFEYL